MRAAGVRTVVWVTPWVNLDSRDGQIPPQPQSERLHREPAPNYAPAAAAGHFVREPAASRWWRVVDGHRLAGRLHQPAAEAWWREQAKQVLELGRRGDQGGRRRGLLHPRRCSARRRAHAARRPRGRSGACTARACSARWTRCIPAVACCSGAAAGPGSTRSATRGAATRPRTSGRCGRWWRDAERGVQRHLELVPRRRRLPRPPAGRALPAGAARPLAAVRLLHAADARARADAAGAVALLRAGRRLYRGYVLLHEQLVPVRAGSRGTAARTGLPIIRPLCLIDPADPRGWSVADAYGYGPALWVAPVLEDGRAGAGGAATAGRMDRDLVREARARGREVTRRRAARADTGLGHEGLGPRHLPRGARRHRAWRHAGVRAPAPGHAVGRAAPRPDGGASRGWDQGQLGSRRVAGRPEGRDVSFREIAVG